ncbi:MAG TPA: (d)CMP kinase [Maribacter sp.]|uniref:(d)CMP kinase n=1 Tax=unclassified Maribacter TaxID=2615042 RepID=UPI000EBCD9FA|nr:MULTISPECIES: (d)CMP kinase [unclassified Maribacter]HAF79004.1 (d)CMP kinase [Maribacter sp.]|tara:strand:- start:1395 stop:2090 length:696 start_codon:yes stop_codon:yes gene_type:complete
MKKITIAIDGFSSTGKSTLAKQLAKKLQYIYVDTGAMYRAVTLFAMRAGLVNAGNVDEDTLEQKLGDVELKFVFNSELGFAEMYLNGENVEKEIRTMPVSKNVSQVAVLEAVRKKLVALQQAMGVDKGIVMDGRDIGTVVFPDAELKIFMTASPEKRAVRRYKELLDRGENVVYEDILENVQKRDYIDSNREISPLRKADDSIEFDNSDLGLEDQFQRIYEHSLRVIEKQV